MKTSPGHDFPVRVMLEETEHEPEDRDRLRGIFEVTLNFLFDVTLVPSFTKENWPAALAEAPTTQDELRRRVAARSHVAITPDPARAGERLTLPPNDGMPRSALFVSDAEFATIVEELTPLVTSNIHDHVLVSKLPAPTFVNVLLTRVIVPGVLTKYELQMLGRSSAPGGTSAKLGASAPVTDLEHLQTYLPLTEDSARRLLDEVAALTESADPRWIRPVLMMLDEHCPLEGVMQRLLEHLEVMAADDLARGLVDVLPVIVRRSPYWATQAVRKLLWEETHTDALIRALRDSDGPQRDAMAGVLDGITTRGLQGAVGAIRESLRAR